MAVAAGGSEEQKLLCCFVVENKPHNYQIYALDLCKFGRCEDLEFREEWDRPFLPDPILTIPGIYDPNGFPYAMCFGFLDGMLYMLGGHDKSQYSRNVYVVDTRAAISTPDIESCIVQGPPHNGTKDSEDIVIPLAGKLFVFSWSLYPFKEDREYLIEVLDTKKLKKKKKNSCCWSNILLPPSVIKWSEENPPKLLTDESMPWRNRQQEEMNSYPYTIESYTAVGSSNSIVLWLVMCTSHKFDVLVLDAETQSWTRRVDQIPKFDCATSGNLLFWDGFWCRRLFGGMIQLMTDRNDDDSDPVVKCEVEIPTKIELRDSWVLRVDDTTLLVFSYGHSNPKYREKNRLFLHTPGLFRVDMLRVDKTTTNEQGNKEIRCKVVKSMAFSFKDFYRYFRLASCYYLLKQG